MQTVDEYRHQQAELAKTKVRLYNPDQEDFTVLYHGKPITIHSMEIEVFSYDEARHIKKHLATHLMNQEDIAIPNDEDWAKIYKKIEVEL